MNLKDKIHFREPVRDKFYNGYSPDETVLLRYDGKVGVLTVRDLFILVKPAERLVTKSEDIWIKEITEEMEVLSRDGFIKLNGMVRRRVYEPLLRIETESKKCTVVSKSHKIPAMKENEEILLRADQLKVGDLLYVSELKENATGLYEKIVKIEQEENPPLSVYGMATESGGAIISGIFQKSY